MALVIQTSRIVIRNFRPEERESYVKLFTDNEVNIHLPKRTEDENRKIFDDTIIADAAGATLSKWAVINRADGDFIGMGLLRPFNDEGDVVEVGYAIHKKYWGQGIGTELTMALVNFAKQLPGLTAIAAVTTPTNIPSQIVLEKAGLIKQGNIVRNNEELAFYKLQLNSRLF